jgi:hypothetical protein
MSGVDDGLTIASPSAPIMASELYANRSAAIAADRYIVVPEVPRQTLSAIARGRIEEIAGWSLMQQGSNAEAVTRLRRAVSILPEKSAWWKSSMWRLGSALEADGKDKDALETYAKVYAGSEPDAVKYSVVETVFKRVNGGTDGLEALVGVNPTKPPEKVTEASPTVSVEAKKETNASPTEEKLPPKIGVSQEPAKVEEKKAQPDKQTEPVIEIPTSVPAETVRKSVARPDDQKPVKKTEEPLPKSEEKQTDSKTTSEEVPKKADQPPQEKPLSREDIPEVKVDEKGDETKNRTEKGTQKSLFDPVVIEVKNPAKPKKSATLAANTEDKGSQRERVVERKETVREKAPPPCNVTVSQESISLVAEGGSIGVLVGTDDGVDFKQLKASASSPKDLEVVSQPEIAGVSGKAFFVIKSLSNVGGDYTVNFSLPCGTKEVRVKVR